MIAQASPLQGHYECIQDVAQESCILCCRPILSPAVTAIQTRHPLKLLHMCNQLSRNISPRNLRPSFSSTTCMNGLLEVSKSKCHRHIFTENVRSKFLSCFSNLHPANVRCVARACFTFLSLWTRGSSVQIIDIRLLLDFIILPQLPR